MQPTWDRFPSDSRCSGMTSANRNLFVSAVKMRIIPTARLFPTRWRWWSRLMSSSRGEPSVRFPSCRPSVDASPMSSHPQPFFSSVSRPDKVFLPPANWKSTKIYGVENDVGPAVEHVYEVIGHSFLCRESGSVGFLLFSLVAHFQFLETCTKNCTTMSDNSKLAC